MYSLVICGVKFTRDCGYFSPFREPGRSRAYLLWILLTVHKRFTNHCRGFPAQRLCPDDYFGFIVVFMLLL